MHERAGLQAEQSDLIDVHQLLAAFTEIVPDPTQAEQRVVFGTSGHRGSSLSASFNEAHIAAMSQAIAEYRKAQGIAGPLYLGGDTHALSLPALRVAKSVLIAMGVKVVLPSAAPGEAANFVPTPALSRAILAHNEHLTLDAAERADGIVVTPSHNPPRDGGFKYNPPHGGPADTDATSWIAARANELLESGQWRDTLAAADEPHEAALTYDYVGEYVRALGSVINMKAIREAGVRIGAHSLGGASEAYWAAIRDHYDLDLTVLGSGIDPQWAFMHLDWDGKIRMDPSSAQVMQTVAEYRKDFDIVTGNDADADRHGIVTRDAGLMNPNHFLAVAIDYLITHRPDWPKEAGIGKTLVSSAIIDRVVAKHGRRLLEVPVGFKWFVPGLSDGSVVFGGEESAGASFQRFDGSAWSTDKDGILLALLAAEIQAVTGKSPSELYRELTETFGAPVYERVDAAATPAQKKALAALSPADVTETELAGDPITAVLVNAPGNGAAIGGLKVQTEHAWFAARPSGTEDVMKVYAESFRGADHLALVQQAAQELVAAVTS
ncbi:phosphoglucomutase (alpha-D-glucose-1,6-bisphosphate-dependent) [Leucobacter sp. UT-8R-CII-1-4]|uniref:phosphoglucomutase (alpha-D-glucose-1,6-bisphosphate-dependent) n=1 Tax=Leucobacter sp. UT-8R-CII-1-4 TaxID=3040075 RepID=UPI0024A82913|nr:phosphoglucomutase (alpha-D-glucose-1,6-bisphosphate-dependent) [Leucobacter sp. UT-8R-CII-1-4]MDI6022766.1 phosphoglucomutase (alpha-D-glucose-1,6-bisphosphate-dependent) [Leucobacter sp. UT-8R-CII-1-4]